MLSLERFKRDSKRSAVRIKDSEFGSRADVSSVEPSIRARTYNKVPEPCSALSAANIPGV